MTEAVFEGKELHCGGLRSGTGNHIRSVSIGQGGVLLQQNVIETDISYQYF